MFAPALHDEATSLAGYVDVQLSGIRAAVYGLTEEQASARPCRSALSIIGIIKHTAEGHAGGRTEPRGRDLRVAPMKPGDVERYMAGFAPGRGGDGGGRAR
jgi:hypothetical protein